MNDLKLIASYAVSLLILPFCAISLFQPEIFQLDNLDLVIYIKLATIFLAFVSFLLCWYYANISIRNDVLKRMNEIGISVINSDFEKISRDSLPGLTDEMIDNLGNYERVKFEFLGVCLPCLIVFVTLLALGISRFPKLIFTYAIACPMSILVVKLVNSISAICNVRANHNSFIKTLRNLTLSIRGIQFYNSINFVKSKLYEAEKFSTQEIEKRISKSVWRSFGYISAVFFLIILAYVLNLEHIKDNLFDIKGVDGIFLTAMLFFLVFLNSLFHYCNNGKLYLADISKYHLEPDSISSKKIDSKNLFVAFHGVYFQDPTKLSDHPIIRDLSMSILPGEFVAITGENTLAREYIFDLIMKFYRPQSGKIYISGSKIENISSKDIRGLIGIFEENFGLIGGTIYENLQIVENNPKKILEVADNVGLSELLEEKIFDDLGDILVSQQTLFRIQIARIAIQKPKILLIKTPETFDSEENEEMFYDFINHSMKRKTILLITDNPTNIVYSNKILYLSRGMALFGSHAELSKNKDYQKFISGL